MQSTLGYTNFRKFQEITIFFVAFVYKNFFCCFCFWLAKNQKIRRILEKMHQILLCTTIGAHAYPKEDHFCTKITYLFPLFVFYFFPKIMVLDSIMMHWTLDSNDLFFILLLHQCSEKLFSLFKAFKPMTYDLPYSGCQWRKAS